MGFLIFQVLLVTVGPAAVSMAAESPDYNEHLLTAVADRLERLDRRLQLLETENHRLQDSVQLLTSENSKLKETLSSVVSDNLKFKETVSSLASENKRQTREISYLKERVLKLMNSKNEELSKQDKGQSRKEDYDQNKNPLTASVHDVSARSDDAGVLEPIVTQLAHQMTEVSADMQALKAAKTQQDLAIQEAGRSTYVRWGHSACPSSATIVYSGVIGGSHEDQSGAASNYLCLSMSPVLSNHPVPGGLAYLYGGEYQTEDAHDQKDPLCAVCRSKHSTTIMVPGTNICLPGWTTEYSGYLMAGYYNHAAASEFICVDSSLQSRISSDANQNGKLLYFTVTHCGSLPCGPYVNNKIVTCAVCSK